MRLAKTAAAALAATLLAALPAGAAPDYPHTWENGASCTYCHDLLSPVDTYLPEWTVHVPQDIDDTAANTLCWSCHTGIEAPFARTHSSRTTSETYGDADEDGEPGWSLQCIVCHDPHYQDQLRAYADASYLAAGTVTAVAADALTCAGASWAEDELAGDLLVPNVLESGLNYRILANTADTITVAGPIDTGRVHAGDDFAVVYGRIVRAEIAAPAGEIRPVRLFRPSGPNSFADGDAVYDGVCEVCHTRTTHFRCTGDAPDQEHEDLGPFAGLDCRGCHGHGGGFAHGTGDAAPGCEACHGHDATFGGGQYYGSTASHSTHTDGDGDDARGVLLACDACHDTGDFPAFASGDDADGDGRIDLGETDACDGCHSPGGTYDGVNDAAVGAKANWEDGIYLADAPRAGAERWCAGCHDEAPSAIGGVAAPNVVGDEDGAYPYGTGWGYYRTGHGLPSSAAYPASGGATAGAAVACDGCHDTAAPHVDGAARTFDDGDSAAADPALYRAGYRLRLVGGLEPLEIPWPGGGGTPPNAAERYRLCAGCHATGAFTDGGDMSTNFVSEGADGVQNRHVTHLGGDVVARFPADWSGANTSRTTCVVCHNVHGSTRLAMVRDGALTGRAPGLQIWYNNDALVAYSTGNPDPPDPQNLPLTASTGVVWIGASAGNLCSHCHFNANTVPEYRTPWPDLQAPPTLAWTGESGCEDDGVHPDAAPAGAEFTFRVLYTDANNDAPLEIQVWVDANDDGDYDDPGERVDLAGVPAGDAFAYDGRLYTAALALGHAGDDTIAYRFHASDGAEATGPPTAGGTLQLLNNAPLLSWTGEPAFAADGVDPDAGAAGATYEFRVLYTDADGDAPALARVWVDADDDGLDDDPEEAHDLAVAPGGNGDYADGEVLAATVALAHDGDGALRYRFEAADAQTPAVAEPGPLGGGEVTVGASANAPPSLAWAQAPCLTEGVRPRSGAAGADFDFIVSYADADDPCPASGSGDVALWVDLDDSGAYDAGEGFALPELDPGDTDCTDGKLYGTALPLAAAGDGDLPYAFAATDGTDAAGGAPTLGALVTVAAATRVRPEGGAGWETAIATAVNNNPGLTLVYPHADYTAATYPQTFVGNAKHDRTVRAVCGPELTVVDAAGAAYALLTQNNNNVEFDGFTITGGASYGFSANGGTGVALRNSVVAGNPGSGVFTATASLAISGCEIHGNGAATAYGGGISLTAGTHTISDTVVRDNGATVSGGGLMIQNAVSATLERVVVRGNDAASLGGGIYFNNAAATLSGCEISGNASGSHGGGIYVNNNTVSLAACTITGNTAGGDGGGMLQTGTPAVALENCVLADNEGNRGGGAFVNDDETATLLVNTTVADNRARAGEGGAYYLNCAELLVRNGIFWGNAATGLGQTFFKGGCAAADSVLTDTDVSTGSPWTSGGTWVTDGNIDPAQDPRFVGAGDYHLREVSPAIDRANPAYAPDSDIDGDPRPQGGADDLGADEYVP